MVPSFLDVAVQTQPESMIVDMAADKIPVILLIDTSESMDSNSIDHINIGIRQFRDKIVNDEKLIRMVEIALISFNDTVKIIHPFSSIKEFDPASLIASSQTSMMGHGILTAIDQISSRKNKYCENGVAFYPPRIFMITAGAATDMGFTDSKKSQNVELLNKVISAVHDGEDRKHFDFYSVAVGNAVDVKQLKAIAKHHPPVQLKREKWNEMFSWIVHAVDIRRKRSPSIELWAKSIDDY